MTTINDLVPGKTYPYKHIGFDSDGNKLTEASKSMRAYYSRPRRSLDDLERNSDDPHGKDWVEANCNDIPGEGTLEIVALIGPLNEPEDTKVLYKIDGDEEIYQMDSEEMEWILNYG